MSKTRKTPQEKKRLSLQKDCRNDYGENDKSSRKNIPLQKAKSHRRIRRKSSTLEKTLAKSGGNDTDVIESTLTKHPLQKPYWKKSPDAPLNEFIIKQREKAITRERSNRGRNVTASYVKPEKISD